MSVTAEYTLISWHVGEKTDLLLRPGSELSELDNVKQKWCVHYPHSPQMDSECWWGSHDN